MARILIADDDPMYVAAFLTAVEALGHEGHGVGDGAKVMPSLTERPADVVFLDVLMPGGGAISLVHQIRETHPDMKIVVITGRAVVFDSPILQDGLRDADARVPKTISLEELSGLLDGLGFR